MLSVEGLTKRFGGLVAVSGVSFEVERGEVVSLVGPNGAGKSTVFNLITGVTPPDEGRVVFKGRPVTGYSPDQLARMGIGRTFQNIRLFSHLNALENVMVGRVSRARSGLFDALSSSRRGRHDREDMLVRAEELLEWVGVGANRLQMPKELPYGVQRRVEIARALALEPELLILDEPTAGMVVREAHEVIELIAQLKEAGLTLLLIEHNMNVVMAASDRVVVLNFGREDRGGPAGGDPGEPDRDRGLPGGRGLSALLSVSDLIVSYGSVPAVNGVSLEIHPGELRVILGANGAGKTTIIKTILGLLKPRSGKVRFSSDHDLVGLKPHQIHRLGISWVPEGRQLWDTLSVLDNLKMGAYVERDRTVVDSRDRSAVRALSASSRATIPACRFVERR